jgi:hypothetical protein
MTNEEPMKSTDADKNMTTAERYTMVELKALNDQLLVLKAMNALNNELLTALEASVSAITKAKREAYDRQALVRWSTQDGIAGRVVPPSHED